MIYLDLFLYFLAGVVQDFLLTANARFIIEKKVFLASTAAFLTTIVTTFVLYNLLTKFVEPQSFGAIVVYALGIATGTFLAMKLRIKKNRSI